MKRGQLFIVSTPIGNLEDITLRALKVLKSAHLIAAEDTRRTRILLKAYEIQTPLVSLHEHNEMKKCGILIEKMKMGEDVAYVTDAGTPGVSDPGFVLIRETLKEGLTVTAVPGPSAVIAALVVSGLPMGAFIFEGFLPVRKKERQAFIASLREEKRTMVFFESPRRIVDALGDIYAVLGNRPVAVVRELTKVHEEVLRGNVQEIMDRLGNRQIKGEITLVLGGATDRKEVSDEEIEEALANLEGQGLSSRERIDTVTQDKGVARRRVYKIELKRKA